MSESKIPAAQRRELILKAIQSDGFVTVLDMAKAVGTSEMTVRRDLEVLSEHKKLTRIHGGAMSNEHQGGLGIDLIEPSVDKRATQHREAKEAIARNAATMLNPDQTIALDIGTTTFELAALLRDMPLRVFTNSLKIANYLNQGEATTYMPGGQVGGTEPSISGAVTIKHLNEFFFDIAFIGVSGLSADGFYDYSLEDAEIKRVMIARCNKSVVLLDSSKFDRMSVSLVAGLADIDVLITDTKPPKNLYQALKANSVEVVIAQTLTDEVN